VTNVARPGSSGAGPADIASDGVRVTVRLTPKAARNRIEGVADTADGSLVLKVSVTAVPEKGKANAALLKLLAEALRVPKSSLSIVAGATDRRKVVLVGGADPALAATLAAEINDRARAWARDR